MLCSPITVGMYNQEVNLQPGFLLTYWWNNQFQRIKCHGFFFLVKNGCVLADTKVLIWAFVSWALIAWVALFRSFSTRTTLRIRGNISERTANWYQMESPVLQTDAVGWPSHIPYHPLVPDLERSVLRKATIFKDAFFLNRSYHVLPEPVLPCTQEGL